MKRETGTRTMQLSTGLTCAQACVILIEDRFRRLLEFALVGLLPVLEEPGIARILRWHEIFEVIIEA